MTFTSLLQAFTQRIPKQMALSFYLLRSVLNLSVSVQVTVNPYNALHHLITAT
jgi:hypothetical protein